jgi:mannose-6-phosphate isomerase-like protein (cupin superfamily)
MTTPKDRYPLEDVRAGRAASCKRYLEFLRIPAMSAGLYALAAGAEDTQSPHGEDELYYVVRGRAKFRIGGTERGGATRVVPVEPGDTLFVAARVAHKFFEITEDLELLVFFAPAETE